MAEGRTTKRPVALDETHKEPEECAICYSGFKFPRFLDCSHRFCLKCLQEFKQTQNTENIVCPICRRETLLPEEGVDMLPTESQGKAGTSQEQHEEGRLEVMCQACDENNEAISRCMECDSFLCGACQNAHQRLGPLRSHKVATLTELGSETSIQQYEFQDKVPKCEKHPDEDICLYCESCEVLICNTCITFEHKPSMHTHCNIDEAFSKCSKEINDQMSQTKEYVKQFNSTHLPIEHARTRLDKMLMKTKIQISMKAEKEIAQIRWKEEQIKKEAQRIATTRDKEFATAAKPEETLNKVNKKMTSASQYTIIKSKRKLIHDLQENVAVHKSLGISYNKSFLGFKESFDPGELGTLVQEEKWKLEKEFTIYCGKYVAVYSTGELLVANDSHLFLYNPHLNSYVITCKRKAFKPCEGKLESHEPNDIQNPTALTINKDDQLIILDDPAVKIFSREYQLLHQFTPGKESDKPTCLAVDDSNLIAVGYKDKEEISLHNPDGSLIQTLSAPMIDENLTISYERLVYTNKTKKKLMAIDYNGKNLLTVTLEHGDGPGAVCCDGAGDIYVTWGNSIKHYSADGKFINHFGRTSKHIIYHPKGPLVTVGSSSVDIYRNV